MSGVGLLLGVILSGIVLAVVTTWWGYRVMLREGLHPALAAVLALGIFVISTFVCIFLVRVVLLVVFVATGQI